MEKRPGAPRKERTMTRRFNGIAYPDTYAKFMRLVAKLHGGNENQALNAAINLYIEENEGLR